MMRDYNLVRFKIMSTQKLIELSIQCDGWVRVTVALADRPSLRQNCDNQRKAAYAEQQREAANVSAN